METRVLRTANNLAFLRVIKSSGGVIAKGGILRILQHESDTIMEKQMNLKRALIILLMAAIIMPSIAMAQDLPPPVTTRFLVEKAFTDGNPGEVEVTLTCNTGLPLTQSAMISFDDPVAFVVTEMIIVDVADQGATTCTITETGTTGETVGYGGLYEANGVNLDDACVFVAGVNLLPDGNFCDIINTPLPVTVTVTKEWVLENEVGHEVDDHIYIDVRSSGVILGDYAHLCYNDEADQANDEMDDWCAYLYFDGSETMTVDIIPSFDGTNVYLYEEIYDSSVESSNTCGNDANGMAGMVTIKPNQGAACKFTNTVFFEGIPTLSQYGLAIMVLLMLGVGFVGFRRFV
jgi:hypothetical protein